MRYKKTLGAFFALLLLLAQFISVSPVRAQATSVGAAPAYPVKGNTRSKGIFIKEIKPGETASDGLIVFNYTKEQRTVNVGVVDSIAAVDGSFSCEQNTEKKNAVGSWIKIEKPQITLQPETNEVVNFTISVPKGTSPGEHNGCITIQDTKNYANKKGSGILLGFRGAVRIAITVPGKIVKELKIIRVETKRLPNGDYTVAPIAKNTGNVSLDVHAYAQLMGFLGQKSKVLADAEYPIMPGSTLGWPYQFKRPFWGGFYKAYTSLSYNSDPSAGIGEGTKETKKIRKVSSYFFIIPSPYAIAIYLSIIIAPLLYLFIRSRRQRRTKRLTKNWEEYVVRTGDSLTGLAKERHASWKKVARVNKIKPPYGIAVDQKLLLPVAKVGKIAAQLDIPAAQPAPTNQQIEVPDEREWVSTPQITASMDKPGDRTIPVMPPTALDSPMQTYDRRPTTFINPHREDRYSVDEDPAQLAEIWNGPSEESETEYDEAIESASEVPAMRWMWDDLGEEPKKKPAPKRTKSKTSTASRKKTPTSKKNKKDS